MSSDDYSVVAVGRQAGRAGRQAVIMCHKSDSDADEPKKQRAGSTVSQSHA